MITNIKSKDFMGHSINEPIGQKTIYTGKNTVGKSTRANIIAITALGFSPFSSKTSKKPSDLLNDFGNGKKMVTEFTCGGVVFERKFTRDSKGSVSNIMRVNKSKVSKADFQVALFKAGDPRIVDLGAFLKISDNEKINTLFNLYPPGADLSNLDSDIEKSKKKISRLKESIGNNEGAIKKLIESKTDIELPAGTLAETRAKITTLTAGVLEAQNALKIAEKKNADELAEQKAAEAKADTQVELNKTMESKEIPYSVAEKQHEELKSENVLYENNTNSNIDLPSMQDPAESIQRIIDTMAKTDCSMCAGLMVAKVELRKFKP